MFPKTFFLVFFSFCYFCLRAQTESIFSVSFSEVGPAYEHSLGKNMSAKLQLGFYATTQTFIDLGIGTTSSSATYYFLHPGGNLSLRSYYNYNRREKLGKNVSRNTANYFALVGMYLAKPFYNFSPDCSCTDFNGNPIRNDVFANETATRGLLAGMVWGMQRNYKGRFSLDLNVGIGYNYSEKIPTLLSTTTLGMWLFSRTSKN
jgi:hypothetical protein